MPKDSFRTIIEKIARTKSSSLTVFSDFCRMGAAAVSVLAREAEYLEIAQRYTADELSDISKAFGLLVAEMEEVPFKDLLGPYYLEVASHSSKQARGEFYTPPEISSLMARMLVDVDQVKADGRAITVREPACGSGGMVLALAELFAPGHVDLLRVTCQDINPVAVDMCYINTTLWGIPATVLLGNALGPTITNGWKNPHWHRVGEDQRLAFRQILELTNPSHPNPEIQDDTPQKVLFETKGQLELDLHGFGEMSNQR